MRHLNRIIILIERQENCLTIKPYLDNDISVRTSWKEKVSCRIRYFYSSFIPLNNNLLMYIHCPFYRVLTMTRILLLRMSYDKECKKETYPKHFLRIQLTSGNNNLLIASRMSTISYLCLQHLLEIPQTSL